MRSSLVSGVLLGLILRDILPAEVALVALVPVMVALRGVSHVLRGGTMTALACSGLLFAAFEGALPALPWAFPVALVAYLPWAFLPGAIAARLESRGKRRWALWSLPPAWTAAEFVAGRRELWGSLASPMGIGYTLADSTLLGLAALGGVSAVSLALLSINAALAQLLVLERDRFIVRATTVLLWLGVAIGSRVGVASAPWQAEEPTPSAFYRSDSSVLGDRSIRVALVQPDAGLDAYRAAEFSPDAREWLVERLLHLSRSAGTVDLVIWPEGSLPPGLGLMELPERMGNIAVESELLLGAALDRPGAMFNSLVQVADGFAEPVFDKLALVPVGERGIRAGMHLVVAEASGVAAGPLICLDAIYAGFARRLALLGAEFLLVVSDDSFAGSMATGHLHLKASRFRAVETGLPLVFASASGPSAVVSATGSLLAVSAFRQSSVLVSPVPMFRRPTLFILLGEWVGIVVSIFTGGVAFTVLRER